MGDGDFFMENLIQILFRVIRTQDTRIRSPLIVRPTVFCFFKHHLGLRGWRGRSSPELSSILIYKVQN